MEISSTQIKASLHPHSYQGWLLNIYHYTIYLNYHTILPLNSNYFSLRQCYTTVYVSENWSYHCYVILFPFNLKISHILRYFTYCGPGQVNRCSTSYSNRKIIKSNLLRLPDTQYIKCITYLTSINEMIDCCPS